MYLRICVTGRPGIGKSTVVSKVINRLRSMGYRVGGIICPEERVGGRRVGFKIIDLLTGREGWLAKVPVGNVCPYSLTHGKYCIILSDVINVGVNALKKASQESDVLIIDEVGPMELKVPELRSEIINVLRSFSRPLIAVVHYRLRDFEIKNILRGCRYFEVTFRNRNYLPNEILKIILNSLRT